MGEWRKSNFTRLLVHQNERLIRGISTWAEANGRFVYVHKYRILSNYCGITVALGITVTSLVL